MVVTSRTSKGRPTSRCQGSLAHLASSRKPRSRAARGGRSPTSHEGYSLVPLAPRQETSVVALETRCFIRRPRKLDHTGSCFPVPAPCWTAPRPQRGPWVLGAGTTRDGPEKRPPPPPSSPEPEPVLRGGSRGGPRGILLMSEGLGGGGGGTPLEPGLRRNRVTRDGPQKGTVFRLLVRGCTSLPCSRQGSQERGPPQERRALPSANGSLRWRFDVQTGRMMLGLCPDGLFDVREAERQQSSSRLRPQDPIQDSWVTASASTEHPADRATALENVGCLADWSPASLFPMYLAPVASTIVKLILCSLGQDDAVNSAIGLPYCESERFQFRRSSRCTQPPSPRRLNLKPKERPRKRWADWSDSGSDDDDDISKQVGLTLKMDGVDGEGLVISSEDPGTAFRSVCSSAVLSRARKSLITTGITQLRDHDKALKSLLSISNLGTIVGPKHIVVFTSEPHSFQDPMVHCSNVGTIAAGRWTPNGARKELQDLGSSLVVVAIKYNDHNEGLNHSDLLDEVISHCELGRDSVPLGGRSANQPLARSKHTNTSDVWYRRYFLLW